jgi:type I restriction enzyme M protein
VLIDASKMGSPYKDGKLQKTLLSDEEENQIVAAFNQKKAIEDFSVVVNYDDIKAKNYSFSAGQYFEVKIEYVDITHEEFEAKMQGYKENLSRLFAASDELEREIKDNLNRLELNE